MGLLDEAIRDHLELKRRRGADPTEIAREQSEALDPVFPAEPVAADPAPEDQPGDSPTAAEDGQRLEQTPLEATAIGQETAELDMQSVLHEATQPAETLRGDGPAEEELEWEMPDRSAAEPPPEPLPGQERLTFE